MSGFAVVVSPLMRCPACDSSATMQLAGDEPEPGDLVVCIGCEAICVLTPEMLLRLFDENDLAFYTLDDLARVTRAVRQLRAAYQRRN